MAVDPHLAPHWDTAALVTIDMQRDFLSDGPFGLAGTTEILPALTRIADAFRAAGRPVVHIVRLYPADGEDVDRVRRSLVQGGAAFARPGTPGRLLAPGLAPVDELDDEALLRGEPQQVGPAEYVVYKPRWGAFYRTRLDELLTRYGVDTLVFAGCNLPNCPRASIIEAHERDYRVVLVSDAVSQVSDQGLREVAGLGTVLCGTDETIASVAPLRQRLRAALPAAMKSRDRHATAALRATLAAIDNAEAVAPDVVPVSLAIEDLPVGAGATEAARRELTEAEVAEIVRGEVAEREAAAVTYEDAGHPERATRLRDEARSLSALL